MFIEAHGVSIEFIKKCILGQLSHTKLLSLCTHAGVDTIKRKYTKDQAMDIIIGKLQN